MKLISIVFALVLSAPAWAYDDGTHSISGALGFVNPGMNVMNGSQNRTASFALSGLIGLGVDYDYNKNKDFSFGGFMRYYTVSGTVGGHSIKNNLFALGPDVKGYISNETWMGYMGAGLEYMSPSYSDNGTDFSLSSGIGLMMSVGLMYKYSPTIAFGLETMRLTGLSSDINGSPVEDYMFKARFQL